MSELDYYRVRLLAALREEGYTEQQARDMGVFGDHRGTNQATLGRIRRRLWWRMAQPGPDGKTLTASKIARRWGATYGCVSEGIQRESVRRGFVQGART